MWSHHVIKWFINLPQQNVSVDVLEEISVHNANLCLINPRADFATNYIQADDAVMGVAGDVEPGAGIRKGNVPAA